MNGEGIESFDTINVASLLGQLDTLRRIPHAV